MAVEVKKLNYLQIKKLEAIHNVLCDGPEAALIEMIENELRDEGHRILAQLEVVHED